MKPEILENGRMILKTAIRKGKTINEKEEKIIRMVSELEELLIENKDITIEQTDKGKKTIIIERENGEIIHGRDVERRVILKKFLKILDTISKF